MVYKTANIPVGQKRWEESSQVQVLQINGLEDGNIVSDYGYPVMFTEWEYDSSGSKYVWTAIQTSRTIDGITYDAHLTTRYYWDSDLGAYRKPEANLSFYAILADIDGGWDYITYKSLNTRTS